MDTSPRTRACFGGRDLPPSADLVTEEVPVAFCERALCRLLLLSLFAAAKPNPLLPSKPCQLKLKYCLLVSEVISILMEIHIYRLIPILLIQCTYNNAFHIIIALLCEYKFRLQVHNMLFLPELSQ